MEVATSFVKDAIHFRFTKGRRVDKTAIRIHRYMHENWRRFVIVISILNCAQIMWNPPHESRKKWIALETFCACVFLTDVALGLRMQPFRYYKKEIWNQLKMIVLVVTFFDMFLALTGATPVYLRFSWCLRPFCLKNSDTVKVLCIYSSCHSTRDAGFFSLFLGVFAGLSFVILETGLYTQENVPHGDVERANTRVRSFTPIPVETSRHMRATTRSVVFSE